MSQSPPADIDRRPAPDAEAERDVSPAVERSRRRPYRPPSLESGERLETTTLASCRTGPQFCGSFAVEA